MAMLLPTLGDSRGGLFNLPGQGPLKSAPQDPLYEEAKKSIENHHDGHWKIEENS